MGDEQSADDGEIKRLVNSLSDNADCSSTSVNLTNNSIQVDTNDKENTSSDKRSIQELHISDAGKDEDLCLLEITNNFSHLAIDSQKKSSANSIPELNNSSIKILTDCSQFTNEADNALNNGSIQDSNYEASNNNIQFDTHRDEELNDFSAIPEVNHRPSEMNNYSLDVVMYDEKNIFVNRKPVPELACETSKMTTDCVQYAVCDREETFDSNSEEVTDLCDSHITNDEQLDINSEEHATINDLTPGFVQSSSKLTQYSIQPVIYSEKKDLTSNLKVDHISSTTIHYDNIQLPNEQDDYPVLGADNRSSVKISDKEETKVDGKRDDCVDTSIILELDNSSLLDEDVLSLSTTSSLSQNHGKNISDNNEEFHDTNLEFERKKLHTENASVTSRNSSFYEHDDRMYLEYVNVTSSSIESVVNKEENDVLKIESMNSLKMDKDIRPIKSGSRSRKIWTGRADVEEKWCHDLYVEESQMPKSTQELIDTYGYDIRKEKAAPEFDKRGSDWGYGSRMRSTNKHGTENQIRLHQQKREKSDTLSSSYNKPQYVAAKVNFNSNENKSESFYSKDLKQQAFKNHKYDRNQNISSEYYSLSRDVGMEFPKLKNKSNSLQYIVHGSQDQLDEYSTYDEPNEKWNFRSSQHFMTVPYKQWLPSKSMKSTTEFNHEKKYIDNEESFNFFPELKNSHDNHQNHDNPKMRGPNFCQNQILGRGRGRLETVDISKHCVPDGNSSSLKSENYTRLDSRSNNSLVNSFCQQKIITTGRGQSETANFSRSDSRNIQGFRNSSNQQVLGVGRGRPPYINSYRNYEQNGSLTSTDGFKSDSRSYQSFGNKSSEQKMTLGRGQLQSTVISRNHSPNENSTDMMSSNNNTGLISSNNQRSVNNDSYSTENFPMEASSKQFLPSKSMKSTAECMHGRAYKLDGECLKFSNVHKADRSSANDSINFLTHKFNNSVETEKIRSLECLRLYKEMQNVLTELDSNVHEDEEQVPKATLVITRSKRYSSQRKRALPELTSTPSS